MSKVKPEGFFGGKVQDLVQELREFIGQKVNVEFECGNAVKRAVGGTLVEVGSDFIQLNGTIKVVTFVPGIVNPIVKNARVVVIPIDHICSVEKP